MTDEKLKQAAEIYTEEYYFETPVQFFMAGADIGSRETKEELERVKLRLMTAESIIKDLLLMAKVENLERNYESVDEAKQFLEEVEE